MYTRLASNVDTLKDRVDSKGKSLQSKDAEISIVALDKDLENGIENPIFYASRYGMIYNPHENFKPNIAGNHAIKDQLVDDYWEMLPAARQVYKEKLKRWGNKVTTVIETVKEDNGELEKMKQLLIEQNEQIKAQQAKISELAQQAKQGDGIIRHEKFGKIMELLERKQAVYLHGPAGTGKSELVKQLALDMKLDFYPASTVTQEFKLTGFKDGNGIFHDTNFYKAIKFGGLFFMDEMDSCVSEVLVGINGALANGYFDFPGETIQAHKDFRMVGAGNTIGRGGNEFYTGRVALDISTLDRFWAIPLYYSPAIDNAVSNGDKELVEFANAMRKASERSGINILMSYRSISRIANFQDLFSLEEIMEMAVIKGIATDDVMMLAQNMEIESKNKYYKAFKQAA